MMAVVLVYDQRRALVLNARNESRDSSSRVGNSGFCSSSYAVNACSLALAVAISRSSCICSFAAFNFSLSSSIERSTMSSATLAFLLSEPTKQG